VPSLPNSYQPPAHHIWLRYTKNYSPLSPNIPSPIVLRAVTPNKPPVVFPTCPVATPKAILPTSTISKTIPAQIALLISLHFVSTVSALHIPSTYLLPLSPLSLSSAVISSSPNNASRAPIMRTSKACSAGTLCLKSAHVKRGATRQAAPVAMRTTDSALMIA
jgi:hypothetical protein